MKTVKITKIMLLGNDQRFYACDHVVLVRNYTRLHAVRFWKTLSNVYLDLFTLINIRITMSAQIFIYITFCNSL